VVDPRSGQEVVGARLAVVTGPSARTCDAWSTAALVAGVRPEALPSGYETVIVG
jgi:thiamine biosynthesis lipoprotein ApbE